MAKSAHGSNRRTATELSARVAGGLIVVGYLTYGLPDGLLIQPLLDTTEPLASIAAASNQLTIAALLMAVNSAAVLGIGLLLYPTLKRHDRTIALGYLVTRLFEAVLLTGGIICLLLLVPLSQEYVAATAGDPPSLRALGALAVQANAYAYSLAMIGLAVGSIPLCYLLYRTRLVPRWLPAAGLLGYPTLILLMVVEIVGAGPGPLLYALYVPGAIFELGLAGWLVVNGIESAASHASDTSRTSTDPVE